MSSSFEWNVVQDEFSNSELNDFKRKMTEVFHELEQRRMQAIHNFIRTPNVISSSIIDNEQQQQQQQKQLNILNTTVNVEQIALNDIKRKMDEVLSELLQRQMHPNESYRIVATTNATTHMITMSNIATTTTITTTPSTVLIQNKQQQLEEQKKKSTATARETEIETATITALRTLSNNWINRVDCNEVKSSLTPSPLSATQTTTHDSTTNDLRAMTTMMATIEKPINENALTQKDVNIKHPNKKLPSLRRSLPEKVFVQRDSPLTTLFQVDHIKTIYHVFLVIFLILCLHTITNDYFTNKGLQIGLKTCQIAFGQLPKVLLIWLNQQLVVIGIWPALKMWAQFKWLLSRKNQYLEYVWSYSCLSLYIVCQICFYATSCWLCIKWKLPFVTAISLQIDTVRLLMKMHAFIRTNVPIICQAISMKYEINGNDDTIDDEKKIRMPPIYNYIYFLFAPTIIYRDHYPRNRYIRWKFVMARFIEIIASIFINIFIFEHYIQDLFKDFGLRSWSFTELCLKFITILLPFDLLLLTNFYLVLHSWHNCTGELLKFGDRMFYKDWWTATNYETYFRNWNVIVHDWLYEYIYKDFYFYIFKGNKLYASLTVFTISALFHELCINFTLRFFFPATYILFGIFGVLLVFITRAMPKTFGNILLWFTLIFGNGILVTLYSMEYYGNKNCPKIINKWYDHLLPHIFYCYQKAFN